MKQSAKNTNRNQGFTLIEVLVVISILSILMAITIIAINPVAQFASARNAQRSADITTILDAIYAYEAGNSGSLPSVLSSMTTATAYAIATTGTNKVDLCSALTPTYVADLPRDPSSSVSSVTGGSTPCAAGVSAYVTGYTITKSTTGNRFTVAAPGAENGATITVTR